MATTARGVSLLPSRIPQKTTQPSSVVRVTNKIASLNLNTTNTSGKVKPMPPSPKKPEPTVRKIINKVPTTEKKTPVAPTRVSPTTQSKSTNGIVKTNTSVKKKPEQTRKVATPPGMSSCKICARHFASERIQKHQEICEKSTKKKRKVFDPLKQRLKGTDAEGMIKQIKMTTKTPEKPKKNSWRKQHEDFIANIRAARQVKEHLAKGGKLSDLPPPPPMDTSSYVQCPHCNRKFNEAAAQRHIAACANMRHNKPKPGLAKNDKQITNNKMITKKR